MQLNIVLKNNFEKWLNTLGYAQSTIYASTNYVNDFFFYLKNTEITSLEEIGPETINTYFAYLQTRKKKNQHGGLSNNYIISNINALKRFGKYLGETGKGHIEIRPKLKAEKENIKTILTKAETGALYKACTNDYLGIRDRAMLGIFYGCGLRRGEGLALDTADVLLKEKRVFVRKGKNYKERYVPMTERVKEDLENYIYLAREKIISFRGAKQDAPDGSGQALFLNRLAKRLGTSGLLGSLKKLARGANIQKDPGIHTLRHSIATHLLWSGLGLEEIKQFLGHASLESTQIYTHIANQ